MATVPAKVLEALTTLAVDQTDYATKLILSVRTHLFIQLYANRDTGP